jgi:hypothetical protein
MGSICDVGSSCGEALVPSSEAIFVIGTLCNHAPHYDDIGIQ